MQGQTNVVIALTANPLDGLDLVQGQKHGPMRNQPSAPRRAGEQHGAMRLGLVLGLAGMAFLVPDIAARPVLMIAQLSELFCPAVCFPARKAQRLRRVSVADGDVAGE